MQLQNLRSCVIPNVTSPEYMWLFKYEIKAFSFHIYALSLQIATNLLDVNIYFTLS